jgi:hypothetical protein
MLGQIDMQVSFRPKTFYFCVAAVAFKRNVAFFNMWVYAKPTADAQNVTSHKTASGRAFPNKFQSIGGSRNCHSHHL